MSWGPEADVLRRALAEFRKAQVEHDAAEAEAFAALNAAAADKHPAEYFGRYDKWCRERARLEERMNGWARTAAGFAEQLLAELEKGGSR